MRLSTTTADLEGYAKDKARELSLFEGTGFRNFDLSMYNINRPGSLYLAKSDEWKKEIEAIGIMAEKIGYSFSMCHSPSGQYFAGEEK